MKIRYAQQNPATRGEKLDQGSPFKNSMIAKV